MVTFLHLYLGAPHHPQTLLATYSNLSKNTSLIANSKCPLHQPKSAKKSIVLSVYNLRIFLNLFIWMSNSKINLPRWGSTCPDYFSTNIYIFILNNCIDHFNKF